MNCYFVDLVVFLVQHLVSQHFLRQLIPQANSNSMILKAMLNIIVMMRIPPMV